MSILVIVWPIITVTIAFRMLVDIIKFDYKNLNISNIQICIKSVVKLRRVHLITFNAKNTVTVYKLLHYGAPNSVEEQPQNLAPC